MVRTAGNYITVLRRHGFFDIVGAVLANSGASRIRDRKDVLPAAIFVALFCLMFRDFFFTNKSLFDRDVTLWDMPARKLCTQLLRQGGLALGRTPTEVASPSSPTSRTRSFILPIFSIFVFPFSPPQALLLHPCAGDLDRHLLSREILRPFPASFLPRGLALCFRRDVSLVVRILQPHRRAGLDGLDSGPPRPARAPSAAMDARGGGDVDAPFWPALRNHSDNAHARRASDSFLDS